MKPWQLLQYLTANIKEQCKDDPCTVNKESSSVAEGALSRACREQLRQSSCCSYSCIADRATAPGTGSA